MRHAAIAIFVVILVVPLRADEQVEGKAPACPIQGTWRLVAGKYGDATEFQKVPPEETMFKFVTDTHFTWVRFHSETKEIFHAAGGRCTVDGDKYTELIEFGLGEVMNLKGEKQTFTWKVEGDKWHHSGTLSNGAKIEEIFERIKKEPIKR